MSSIQDDNLKTEVFRQVFALSAASNLVGNYKGTQSYLQSCLEAELPSIVDEISGQWKVVWGPVVWKDQPDNSETGPDNSWFVARNPSVVFDDGSTHDTYVVAIAGTATYSMYGWTTENLAVDRVVDFPTWVEGGITRPPVTVNPEDVDLDGTYAANGTTATVHNLLTLPNTADSAGPTLYEFLSRIPGSSTTRIVFTGHSLGGALSPTMALALVKSGALNVEASVYFTAGASPGNGNFANLFAQTFPASQCSDVEYAVWNTNIINSLDIVPQAWCAKRKQSPAQNLNNIPPIYGLPVIPFIAIAIFFLKYQANCSGIVYVPLQSRIIPGTRPSATPKEVLEFLNVALENHGAFYRRLFGIDSMAPVIRASYGLVEKSEEEKLLGIPVIGSIEWGNEHRDDADAAVAALLEGELDDE